MIRIIKFLNALLVANTTVFGMICSGSGISGNPYLVASASLLNEVRKTNKNLKFIILTFYVLEQYKKIAIDSGVNYFLSKADDFDKIEDIIKNINLSQ